MKPEQPGWGRPLTEGIVIVVGILIAFSIDAAWDRYKAGTALRESLVSVRDDLARSQTLLVNSWIPWHAGVAASSVSFLWLVETGAPPPFSSSTPGEWYRQSAVEAATALLRAPEREDRVVLVADSLISRTLFTPTFDPSVPSLTAMTNGGELALIENRDLRAALAEIPSLLLDLADEEVLARDHVVARLETAISSSSSLSHIGVLGGSQWVRGRQFTISEDLLRHSSEIRATKDLANALALRVQQAHAVWGTAVRVHDRIESVISMLDEELP